METLLTFLGSWCIRLVSNHARSVYTLAYRCFTRLIRKLARLIPWAIGGITGGGRAGALARPHLFP